MTVVIATRDRAGELGRTLSRLAGLPEQPAVIVVDNASRDGTADLVRRGHPGVRLIQLPRNRGAVARNIGAAAAVTRFVAFCDDDSWWEPGALDCAARALESCPALAVVAGQILVGPGGEPDPVNSAMARSPLEQDGLPGPRVLGFLACAAVVRRAAFLEVGGFSDVLVFGGEEKLLAMDLAAAGWTAAYISGACARHWPSARRDEAARRRLDARNEVLTAWLRRPAGHALAATAGLARRLGRDPAAAGALASLLRVLPRALRQRRVLPAATEADVRALARWDRERRP
ncbi:MAG TPA: glycosyltransferase [Streptosporangiaceae bacterium]|jgi:GT2 family glycosyltransferase